VGIALGIAAALTWGLADYGAALTSRRLGALYVVLGFHVTATALLAVVAVASGALDGVGWGDLPPFLALGALGCASYVCFYRALAIGPISIVSPIVSGYAAVTVLLAVVVLDEQLSAFEVAAIVVVMTGVVLAASDLAQIRRVERVAALGLVLAVVTMVAIGGFIFGVAYYVDDLGWLAPLFLARGCSLLFLVALLSGTGQWRLPKASAVLVGAVVAVGVLDSAGYVALNHGIGYADTSVVAVASAPYSLVPIALGMVLLRERPAPVQWLGVALVIAGLVGLGFAT
jgi:drug/metabolite transporter (DMT)-like permease